MRTGLIVLALAIHMPPSGDVNYVHEQTIFADQIEVRRRHTDVAAAISPRPSPHSHICTAHASIDIVRAPRPLPAASAGRQKL